MGRHTYTDVCQHVARIGGRIPIDDPHGWILVADACEAGRNANLLADLFAKTKEGKLYLVCVVNEAEYEPHIYNAVFAPADKEWRTLVEDQERGELVGIDDLPPDLAKYEFASGRESVEFFLKDFELTPKIEEVDAIQQTL